ncbi:MAG: NUDIX domain-containing protein [Candidatus Pacebacteria bacterium]|nr:NUDIX domain-containing protein [Candidatus Paceibacterota bacterium]
MPREISAGIIIYKKEKDRKDRLVTKFLLVYHGGGYWNFPKGKMEQGEIGYQTALREVQEETGISPRLLRVERDFKMTDKFIFQREGEHVFKIVIFFLAQTTKEAEVKLSLEHDGYAWLLYHDAEKLLKYRNIKLILKQANDYLKRKNSSQPR